MKQMTPTRIPCVAPRGRSHWILAAVLGLSLQAAQAADTTSARPPADAAVPAALQPAQGESLYLEALANGVQIYECSQKADATYEWAFKAPEAALASRSGVSLGKHYAGPSWESTDGSSVEGEVRARDPGPTPSAIPWLLLNAKHHKGTGVFGSTKSIQRVATVGGVAPSTPCAAGQLKQLARVPYTATYYFYR